MAAAVELQAFGHVCGHRMSFPSEVQSHGCWRHALHRLDYKITRDCGTP